MKSYIKAITIIFVLTLLLAASTTAQTVPTPAQTTPGAAIQGQMIKETNKTADDVRQKLVQLSIATTGQYGGGKVLVIPTEQIQPQDMVALMEDMTVMCNILDKKLEQSNLISGMSFIGVTLPGRPGRFSLGGDSIGAMYIQGYGALFMTTVDFPLSPPPQTEEKEETKDEDADQVWEKMKQEIFSPQEAVGRTPDRPEEKYDAEKVENLKTTLIKALVHAANIRGLQPDESVILTVTGSGVSSKADKVVAIAGTNQVVVHYKDKNVTKILQSPSISDFGMSLPMVLTIRAKKSYIDELAQNKIDFDEFEQKIQLISYPSLGQNIGGKSSTFFWPGQTSRNVYVPSPEPFGVFEGRRSDRRRSRDGGTDPMEQSSGDRSTRR
jgi:hypothetical protein